MSSSTIPTTVRPGQRTLERLAARQQRMLADCSTVAEQLADERVEELSAREIENAEELGGLLARVDAAAPIAGTRALSKTRSAIEQAGEDGSLEDARRAVEKLEAESLRSWSDRTERELLLEELADRAGVRIKEGTKELQADGRLTAAVEIPDHGTMPVSISGGRSAGDPAGSSVVWRAVESDIVGDGTQEGACRAQRQAVQTVNERMGEQMSIDDGEEAERPAPQPHRISRGAR